MDSWEIKINDRHKICRICLEESKTMNNIYESGNIHRLSVAELLKNCMSIKIEEDEELPSLICTQCEAEVLQICEFRTKFDKSEKYLQEYLDNLKCGNIKNEQIIIVKEEGVAENASLLIEYPVEILNEDVKIDNNLFEFVEETDNDVEIKKKQKIKRNKTNEETDHFTCGKCGEIFDTKIKLTNHRRKLLHYARKTVICSQCKLLVPVQNYKSHILKHSSSSRCEICGKSFANNSNLKRHLYIHTNETPYACEICDARFSRQDNLKEHVMIHERVCGDDNTDNIDSKYKRTLSCDICSKSFSLMSSLRIHKLLHTDERVICSDCGKPYPNEKKLHDHKLQVHNKKITKEKEFLCNICARRFSKNDILQKHILHHKGLAKSYKCKICSKNFKQSAYLALHLKIHTGEKPFICHICSRAFSQPSNFQRHLRSHDNVRPYMCSICKKCFTGKQSLIVHTRIHTGEKPFACPTCNKKFVDRGSMNKHIKIHNKLT